MDWIAADASLPVKAKETCPKREASSRFHRKGETLLLSAHSQGSACWEGRRHMNPWTWELKG
jgi:hypothetical protein